ncbi:hypothetical protein B0H17DRAFT_1083442 [Mycena rosella]|uniref:Uncharacterized protein n=1 Tax=Mycena rosella TaxID=1033263 RepID=A0AAD7G6N9_MYCRO|nr:hypothetical protein B0H17DRAFT_1083442 [Mycena rosella]
MPGPVRTKIRESVKFFPSTRGRLVYFAANGTRGRENLDVFRCVGAENYSKGIIRGPECGYGDQTRRPWSELSE